MPGQLETALAMTKIWTKNVAFGGISAGQLLLVGNHEYWLQRRANKEVYSP